jgi:hypothetical protein
MDTKIPMGKSAFLVLKPKAQRIFLIDSKEQVISARSLSQGEQVKIGAVLDFKDHSVLVGECIGTPASASDFISSTPANKYALDSRSFVQVVNSSKHKNGAPIPEAPPVRWKVSCSLFQKGSPSFQAFLILRPQAKRLVLLDMKEEVLDARFLLENERVHSGLIIDLKSHAVLVGERIISDSLVQGVHLLKSSNNYSHSSQERNGAGVYHKDLALDFTRGISFEAACKSKFGHPVTLANFSHRKAFLWWFLLEELSSS